MKPYDAWSNPTGDWGGVTLPLAAYWITSVCTRRPPRTAGMKTLSSLKVGLPLFQQGTVLTRYLRQGLQLPYICTELNWLSKPSSFGHTVQNDQQRLSTCPQKRWYSLSCLPHGYLLDLVIATIPRSQLIFG
jgi:hypothetical protein